MAKADTVCAAIAMHITTLRERVSAFQSALVVVNTVPGRSHAIRLSPTP